MREALRALNDELERTWGIALQTRTGVNTGEVFTGDRRRGQEPILGDPVNVAARLEQAAEPGEVLLGEATYRLVRDAVSASSVGPLQVKGKPVPLEAWALHEVVPGASGWARNLASALVGRDRELAVLDAVFARVTDAGSCEVVTVFGPAGVGQVAPQPRARRAARRPRDGRRGALPALRRGHHVLADRGGAHGRGRHRRARPARGDAAQDLGPARRRRGRRPRRRAARPAARRRPGAGRDPGDVLGGAQAVRAPRHGTARSSSSSTTSSGASRRSSTCSSTSPTGCASAPVLLLCLARPELLEVRARVGGPEGERDRDDAPAADRGGDRRPDQGLLEGAELEPGARARIAELAEGNPLFVEETLRMLVDDGVLERRDGRWAATRALSEITIPPTIQALLTARLARLDPAERAVIERARSWGACSGGRGGRDLRRRGAPARHPAPAVADAQGAHPARLRPPGLEARSGSRHILIRDAAYQGIPKAERAELHERLADWLEVERAATRPASSRRSSATTSSRRARLLLELARSATAPRLGRRAATILAAAGARARSTAATCPRPRTCSRGRPGCRRRARASAPRSWPSSRSRCSRRVTWTASRRSRRRRPRRRPRPTPPTSSRTPRSSRCGSGSPTTRRAGRRRPRRRRRRRSPPSTRARRRARAGEERGRYSGCVHI